MSPRHKFLATKFPVTPVDPVPNEGLLGELMNFCDRKGYARHASDVTKQQWVGLHAWEYSSTTRGFLEQYQS